MKFFVVLSIIVIGLTSVACAPITKVSGFVPIQKEVDQLKIGFSTKEEVLNILGEPLNLSQNPSDSLLYVQQKFENVAFLKPRVRERTVVKLSFNKSGVLQEIGHQTTVENKEFDFEKQIVEAKGRNLTFWQQMFGNIGNFSSEQFLD